MEQDYAILTKVFIDKEKENMKIKEELDILKLKTRTQKSEDFFHNPKHDDSNNNNTSHNTIDFAHESNSNPGTFGEKQIKGSVVHVQNNDIKKQCEDNAKNNEDHNEIYENSAETETSSKKERIELQKKYLNEIIEIQRSFEDFKTKTANEIRYLKKQKQDAINEANLLKQSIEQIKDEQEVYIESLTEENISLKTQLEMLKGLEDLKYQNDCLMKENKYLRMKLSEEEGTHVHITSKQLKRKNTVPIFEAQFCDDPISYKDMILVTSQSSRRTALQSNNSDAQLKTDSTCQNKDICKTVSNTITSHRSIISNQNDNSNSQEIKNESTYNEDVDIKSSTHESLEDNIIEVPLQIKIKGKIKKISTGIRK